MKVSDYIKTEVAYIWNWETVKRLDDDWVELLLRDKTRVCGWLKYAPAPNSRYGDVYITSRFNVEILKLTPDMIDTEIIDEYPHVILPTGIVDAETEGESDYALEKYSDLVIKRRKEKFLTDKFIDDFSTLISNMVASRTTDDELDTIIRFTGMVLNNKTKESLGEALDDYPTVPKIFDKYINVKSMGSGITVDVAKLYCIKDVVTSHYFETGDGYFDATTAFKYLIDGKKVRQVDWTPDEYIKLCRYKDSIIDENNEDVNQNIIIAGRDAKWELFKEVTEDALR